MTAKEFDLVLSARLEKCRAVLAAKSVEYSTEGDKLHNFKKSAAEFPIFDGETPEETLLGMMRKHWTSISDLVNRRALGGQLRPEAIDEKIGDAVNYLILLEALLLEKANG